MLTYVYFALARDAARNPRARLRSLARRVRNGRRPRARARTSDASGSDEDASYGVHLNHGARSPAQRAYERRSWGRVCLCCMSFGRLGYDIDWHGVSDAPVKGRNDEAFSSLLVGIGDTPEYLRRDHILGGYRRTMTWTQALRSMAYLHVRGETRSRPRAIARPRARGYSHVASEAARALSRRQEAAARDCRGLSPADLCPEGARALAVFSPRACTR